MSLSEERRNSLRDRIRAMLPCSGERSIDLNCACLGGARPGATLALRDKADG